MAAGVALMASNTPDSIKKQLKCNEGSRQHAYGFLPDSDQNPDFPVRFLQNEKPTTGSRLLFKGRPPALPFVMAKYNNHSFPTSLKQIESSIIPVGYRIYVLLCFLRL